MSRGEEMLDYSETVDVAPGDIADGMKDGPIDLSQVSPDDRANLGLPAEDNTFTDIKWQWDEVRAWLAGEPVQAPAEQSAMQEPPTGATMTAMTPHRRFVLLMNTRLTEAGRRKFSKAVKSSKKRSTLKSSTEPAVPVSIREPGPPH